MIFDMANPFQEALQRGPSILFLGQETLRFQTGIDPLLQELGKHYAVERPLANYRQLLDFTANGTNPNFDWLSTCCAKLGPPAWLVSVAEYPWSAVYSSAIDNIWSLAFKTSWRAIQPYYCPSPDNYRRNKLRIACNHLFGGIGAPETEGRPPLKQLGFITCEQLANAIIATLDTVITPIGSLVIEAYDPENDWLKFETLAGLINKLEKNQAFFFSAPSSLRNNPLAQELIASGQLHLYSAPLGEVLSQMAESGNILLGPPKGDTGTGRMIRIEKQPVNLATAKWINISRAGQPLDISIFEEPIAKSPEKRYQDFRSFLMTSSSSPSWSGYVAGFAFERDYYTSFGDTNIKRKTLKETTLSQLERRIPMGKPIILHGGAGSGKTVTLGLLAYDVAKEGKYPVIFIPQHLRTPNYESLEQFCKWSEDNGACVTLVIWDGMKELREYQNLIAYLEGTKGRRIVVVGSSYRKSQNVFRDSLLIDTDTKLLGNEKKRFSAFLAGLKPGIQQPNVLEKIIDRDDGHFFVALFRLLPETASNLTSAVEQEGRYWMTIEANFAQKIEKIEKSKKFNSLEFAFEKALNSSVNKQSKGTTELDDDESRHTSVSNELVPYVMAPSQYGFSVPLELISRIVGRNAWTSILETKSHSDLIEIIEDPEGELYLQSRHREEARLYCRAAIQDTGNEVAILRRLIENIKIGSVFYGQSELDFATRLLSLIHNDSHKIKFSSHYAEFADALKTLRENRQTNSRLVLQEATFRRKSIKQNNDLQSIAALEDAEGILNETLGQREATENTSHMSQLLGELASCQGFRMSTLAELKGNHSASAKEAFCSSSSSAEHARRLDPTNIHAVDVMAWTSLIACKKGLLSGTEQVEAIAKAIANIASACPNSSEEETQLWGRLLELSQYAGQKDIATKAYENLEAKGSSLGYYLTTIQQLGNDLLRAAILGQDEVIPESNISAYRKSFEYLHEHEAAVINDFRTTYLMIRLWWISKTGWALLRHEHLRVAFKESDWELLLKWTRSISIHENDNIIVPARFLEAIACFHLGRSADHNELFESIRRTNDAGRIRRRLVASNSDGSAIVVDNGVVSRTTIKGGKTPSRSKTEKSFVKFTWKDDEFEIPFRNDDFFRTDLKEGDILDPFVVAFNYIGPFAFPSDYSSHL